MKIQLGPVLEALNSAAPTAAEAQKPSMGTVVEWILHHVVDNYDYVPLGPMKLFGLDGPGGIPITLHVFMFFIGLGILFYLFKKVYKPDQQVQTGFAGALEAMVLFVRNDICIPYLGEKDGRQMAPLFLSMFFLILVFNLLGLVPGMSTVTANINFTMAIAMIPLFLMTIGAIMKNGLKGWLSAFIPHGVPAAVLVIIVPLEMLGVLIKTAVLGLRLFANLIAGHIVLFVILGMMAAFGKVAAPMSLLALFMFFLELFVAFLQAFIFTMLAALFVSQILHPDH